MSLARLLVELARELARDEPGFDPFGPAARAQISGRVSATPLLAALGRRSDATGIAPALLTLQALAINATLDDDFLVSSEIVMTLPASFGR